MIYIECGNIFGFHQIGIDLAVIGNLGQFHSVKDLDFEVSLVRESDNFVVIVEFCDVSSVYDVVLRLVADQCESCRRMPRVPYMHSAYRSNLYEAGAVESKVRIIGVETTSFKNWVFRGYQWVSDGRIIAHNRIMAGDEDADDIGINSCNPRISFAFYLGKTWSFVMKAIGFVRVREEWLPNFPFQVLPLNRVERGQIFRFELEVDEFD